MNNPVDQNQRAVRLLKFVCAEELPYSEAALVLRQCLIQKLADPLPQIVELSSDSLWAFCLRLRPVEFERIIGIQMALLILLAAAAPASIVAAGREPLTHRF